MTSFVTRWYRSDRFVPGRQEPRESWRVRAGVAPAAVPRCISASELLRSRDGDQCRERRRASVVPAGDRAVLARRHARIRAERHRRWRLLGRLGERRGRCQRRRHRRSDHRRIRCRLQRPDRAGESYVVFGRTTGFPAVVRARSLLPQAGGDGSAGFVLNGIDADRLLGLLGERRGRCQRRRHRRSHHRRVWRRPRRTSVPARATSCSGATRQRDFPGRVRAREPAAAVRAATAARASCSRASTPTTTRASR